MNAQMLANFRLTQVNGKGPWKWSCAACGQESKMEHTGTTSIVVLVLEFRMHLRTCKAVSEESAPADI